MQTKRQLLVSYTYDELRRGKASMEELHSGLSVFALSQCLRLFSALNALLRDPSEPVNITAHDALVQWMFPEDVAKRILESRKVALYRQQLLFMMKAAVLSCNGTPREWTKDEWQKIGLLCLMAADLLPTIPKTNSANDMERLVRFVLHFAPIQESALHYMEHNIARSYLMLSQTSSKFKEAKDYVDVYRIFEEATAIQVQDYFALMMGTLSRFFKFDSDAFSKNPNSYSISADWFAGSTIKEEIRNKFFDDLSSDSEGFKEAAEKQTGASDFTLFRNKPMVRNGNTYFPVDYEFLAGKIEANIYWTVLDALKDSSSNFQSFWGRVFEQYIADLLCKSANKKSHTIVPFPKYKKSDREFIDLVVLCDDSAVLLECKSGVFRGDAKYGGDPVRLKAEIDKKFVENQAVSQLAVALNAIREDPDCVEGLSFRYIKTVFPVVITKDEIGSIIGFNGYLALQLRNHLPHRKLFPFGVAPLVCASAEDFERISGFLTNHSIVEILRGHFKSNKAVADPLLKPAGLLPTFVVKNPVLQDSEAKPAVLKETRDEIVNLTKERLNLKD